MKKLTHLVNYKTKQMKNVQTYNPFDTGDNNDDGNYEMSHKKAKFQLKMKSKNHNNNKNKNQLEQLYEPKVHKKNNNKIPKTTTSTTTENAIANSTKTKAGGSNKFLTTITKTTAKKSKHEQQLKPSVSCTSTSSSTSRTAFNGSGRGGGAATVAGDGRNGNNINYNSLERMRNSSCNSTQSIKVNHKRKWPYLWWKQYGRHRKPLTKTWRLKTKLSCWRQLRKKLSSCCKHSSTSSYQYNSDEDDDIDAKFNAYILELQRRDAIEAAKEAEEKHAKLSKTEEGEDEICKTLMPTISMKTQLDLDIKQTNNFTIKTPTTCHTSTITPQTQITNLESSTINATTPTVNTTTTTSTTNHFNNNYNNNRVSFAGLPPRHNQSFSQTSDTNKTTTLQRRHSQHLPAQHSSNKSRRAWTWDDSLRSNSDRFLETLEEDADINDFVIVPSDSFTNTATTSVNSSRCSVSRSRPSLQQLLTTHNSDDEDVNGDDVINDFVVILGEEAKAAAEELNRSPVMGQRNINDPTSSPIQSRGSASSDNWPTQSDEDIDRLVAMHQNRSSLSSLGLRSDSMASVYSGAGEGRYGTVVVKGQVEFGMQYNYKLGALEIHVVRCKDLAAVDAKRNRSDPYVKVYLLPDKSKAGKRKTKVKKHTLNPIFDEVLRFHIPISNLESRTLWLTVWHSDMFGRNDFLGEVSVNLQGRVFDNPQSQWYLLQERSEPFDEVATYRGDIVVGLKYVTPEGSKSKFMRAASLATGGGLRKFGSIKSVASSKTDRSAKGGQLHVLVKEAKHLTPIKPNGTCDAFCKSYLLPDRTRSSKQKTPIVKRSTNPSWNYTFIYEDVSLEDLSERALELTVWDHDRLASNEFLGGVRFSLGTCKSYGRQVDWMDASGKELSLWQNMLDRPNFWVEGSVVLRSSLDGIRAIP